MRKRFFRIVIGVALAAALLGGAVTATTANSGCVGGQVNNSAQGGYRSQEVSTWQQNAWNSNMSPGQLGVMLISQNCGLP